MHREINPNNWHTQNPDRKKIFANIPNTHRQFVKEDDNSINISSPATQRKGIGRRDERESLFQTGLFSGSNPIPPSTLSFSSIEQSKYFYLCAARVSHGRDVRTANNYPSIVTFNVGIEAFCGTQVSHISRFLSFIFARSYENSHLHKSRVMWHSHPPTPFPFFFPLLSRLYSFLPLTLFLLSCFPFLSLISLRLIFFRYLSLPLSLPDALCCSSVHHISMIVHNLRDSHK